MIRHGGDEAHLALEAWHFKCLLREIAKYQTIIPVKHVFKMVSGIQTDDNVLDPPDPFFLGQIDAKQIMFASGSFSDR